jgi:hypothetical protein
MKPASISYHQTTVELPFNVIYFLDAKVWSELLVIELRGRQQSLLASTPFSSMFFETGPSNTTQGGTFNTQTLT